MVPVYAVFSFVSLCFTETAIYLEFIRDCYEAFVIYLFLALLVALLGEGQDAVVVRMLEKLPPMSHLFPLNHVYPDIRLDKQFLRNCKFGTLQFVLIKPLTSFIAILLEIDGNYERGIIFHGTLL